MTEKNETVSGAKEEMSTELSRLMVKNLSALEDPTVLSATTAGAEALNVYIKSVIISMGTKRVADLCAKIATNLLTTAISRSIGVDAWGSFCSQGSSSPVYQMVKSITESHSKSFEEKVNALVERLWKENEDKNVREWAKVYERDFKYEFERRMKHVATSRADVRVREILEKHGLPSEVVQEIMSKLNRNC